MKKRLPIIIKIPLLILLSIILLGLLFSLFRLLSHREVDDVHPGFPCTQELLEKSDVLWIVPLYQNNSIANNPNWCRYILSLNKTLGMHGVYHTFNEFKAPRDQEYLQKGIDSFTSCFGYAPARFKPPQIAWTDENLQLIKSNSLSLKKSFNQVTHKVYHCNDTGEIPNYIMDWI